jgi:MarR family transcriptional regulator, transcriptional regulator for hemolysin
VSEQPLNAHLCWLLDRASHSLLTELSAALDGVGLSPRAHEVLVAARSGEHTQIELARMVGLDKTTMVVTLDELEAAGLVERRPSPSDRRVRVIRVTEAGEHKAREGDDVIHAIHEDVLSTLPAGERTAFMDALARLVGGRLAEPPAAPRPVRRRARRAVA